MEIQYATCRTCAALVAGPTAYLSHLDGQAQLHARVTGHAVEICSDADPDEPVRTIAGEPSLFSS